MKTAIKTIIIFLMIITASAFLLSLSNKITNPVIEKKSIDDAKKVMQELFPGSNSFVQKENYSIFYMNNKIIGYAAEGKSFGYSSEIDLMAAFTKEMKLSKVIIISQKETPGLGAKIEDKNFLDQFKNIDMKDLALKKKNGNIDAITGATISSSNVIIAIKKAYQKIENGK